MQNNITNALLSLLNKGIVNFTYRKVDGSIRTAVGTRNLCFVCQTLGVSIPLPKTGRNNPTAYYDIEKEDWRSFKAENVLSINGVEIGKIKGIKNDRIVPVDSLEDVDIPINVGGGIGVGMGFGGGIPKEEIRKAMEKLDKDIVIGAPAHSPKVGTPTATEKGVALPLNEISVEDFAKMVAKYVVEEFVSRIK